MMKKTFIQITLLVTVLSTVCYSVFVFLRNYNSPEKIEERCISKFQKDFKKGIGKSDQEWGLNIDIANENYFKCMEIH